MTCIAAVVEPKKSLIWMGGDSAATGGYDVSLVPGTKVFHHSDGNFIIGCAGSVRAANVIHYKMQLPEPDTDDIMAYMVNGFVEAMRETLKNAGHAVKSDESEYTGVELLVGFQARLFQIQSDYNVMEVVTGYASIGSGSDLALGALYATLGLSAKKRISLAMSAAVTHNAACRPPFSVIRGRWA